MCNQYVLSDYGNKRFGAMAIKSSIFQRRCYFQRSRVASQLISTYVNYGFESWLTPLLFNLMFFFN